MSKTFRFVLAATFAAALAACGGGGASEPPVTEVPPQNATTKLQFAVGIATIESADGTTVSYGLNTVSTLRQANGLSGALYTEPQIIGPSNFSITPNTTVAQYAGADLGTNHITWATLNQSQWTGPPTQIAQGSTGVFGYGLCPCNSNAGPVNGTTPFFQAFNLPIYGLNPPGFGTAELFYGGPPAFPPIGQTLFNLGFLGYSLGFTDFQITPV
ncbi:MAG: hypothetical protein JO199_13210, partial [Candidatus Eremiobacteraeota bacterium]|nr:hypothetical protein [Candidatus Eremiobacteraeota bacterium]